MAKKMTCMTLFECGQTGRFAVGELTTDHTQTECAMVERGNRFVIKGRKDNEVLAVFPHDTYGLDLEQRVFTDGHVRIVNKRDFKIVGRHG